MDPGELRTLMEGAVRQAQAAGAEFANVRFVSMESTTIGVTDGVAKNLLASHNFGAGVRVLKHGHWGFAPTNVVTAAGLQEALSGALACADAQTGAGESHATAPDAAPGGCLRRRRRPPVAFRW